MHHDGGARPRLSSNTVRNHLAQARRALRAALSAVPRLVRPAGALHFTGEAGAYAPASWKEMP